MHRKFIATIAAAAIAITAFASAPARADSNDAARALATILGIAIIGAAINDARKDKDKVTRHHNYRPRHQYNHDHRLHPKPIPQRVHRRILPGKCLRSFQTDRGRARLFTQRCLNRNYQFVNSLPRSCARQIWTDRGMRSGYGAGCLRRTGYQLAHG